MLWSKKDCCWLAPGSMIEYPGWVRGALWGSATFFGVLMRFDRYLLLDFRLRAWRQRSYFACCCVFILSNGFGNLTWLSWCHAALPGTFLCLLYIVQISLVLIVDHASNNNSTASLSIRWCSTATPLLDLYSSSPGKFSSLAVLTSKILVSGTFIGLRAQSYPRKFAKTFDHNPRPLYLAQSCKIY